LVSCLQAYQPKPCKHPSPICATCPAHLIVLDLITLTIFGEEYRSMLGGASSGCGWKEVLRVRRVAANIMNKQSRTADKGWSSSLGVGRGADNPSPQTFLLLRNVSKRLVPGIRSIKESQRAHVFP
jgi:hypothetical protein